MLHLLVYTYVPWILFVPITAHCLGVDAVFFFDSLRGAIPAAIVEPAVRTNESASWEKIIVVMFAVYFVCTKFVFVRGMMRWFLCDDYTPTFVVVCLWIPSLLLRMN